MIILYYNKYIPEFLFSFVGAFILQEVVSELDRLLSDQMAGSGKQLDNLLMFLAHLYNFKVIHFRSWPIFPMFQHYQLISLKIFFSIV